MENLKVLVYELDGWKDLIEVRLECVKQMDGSDMWAIREKGCCLNKQGEWEIEPIPSSRTSAFYKRCRWKSAEAALKFWRGGHQSRFEHYRTRLTKRAADLPKAAACPHGWSNKDKCVQCEAAESASR